MSHVAYRFPQIRLGRRDSTNLQAGNRWDTCSAACSQSPILTQAKRSSGKAVSEPQEVTGNSAKDTPRCSPSAPHHMLGIARCHLQWKMKLTASNQHPLALQEATYRSTAGSRQATSLQTLNWLEESMCYLFVKCNHPASSGQSLLSTRMSYWFQWN